jgi:leucyl aminopeptidase (aminopeptidase T)
LRYVDLMEQMRVAVEDCLGVKPGEEVLVITDTLMSEDVNGAIMAALKAAKADPLLLTMVTRKFNNEEIPETVGEAMKRADAVIFSTMFSIVHTNAMKAALNAKRRILGMGLISEDMILRTWPRRKEELAELQERTAKLARIIDGSNHARLTSPQGTDLTMEVGKYKCHWGYGVVDEPGVLQFLPGGNTATCPKENTANGQYVVDVSTALPSYRMLRDPITFSVKDGTVISITGGRDAALFRAYLEGFNDPDVFHLAELGVGTNPKCIFTGVALEDERKAGSVRIAVGTDVMLGGSLKTKTHVDGMMSEVTLEFDGTPVVSHGNLLI